MYEHDDNVIKNCTFIPFTIQNYSEPRTGILITRRNLLRDYKTHVDRIYNNAIVLP